MAMFVIFAPIQRHHLPDVAILLVIIFSSSFSFSVGPVVSSYPASCLIIVYVTIPFPFDQNEISSQTVETFGSLIFLDFLFGSNLS